MASHIGRRKFLATLGGAAAAWPLAARAQQPERMRHIGVLVPGAANDPVWQVRIGAFQQALALSGWIIGRNVRIDIRWGNNDPDRIRKNVAELVATAPDVILAAAYPVIAPLQAATSTVPRRGRSGDKGPPRGIPAGTREAWMVGRPQCPY